MESPDVSEAPPPVDLSGHIAAKLESDDIEKPEMDTRSYRWLRLSNEMQVLLVHDAECDNASAAMEVGIGSASDPESIPGLAHFLEHMLFLGTEKYPKEDEYQSYLEQHGGGCNAFTAHENTTYYFQIQQPFLRGALDRFAQFFLAPLFTESATFRELNAVDSENSKNLQSDQWRLQQLIKWAADPRHPWSKFNVGNVDTLRDQPSSSVNIGFTTRPDGTVAASLTPRHRPAQELRAALLDFHAEHYSANLMCLAVVGRESLDELAQFVVPLFAAVPNKKCLVPRFPFPPYPLERLGRHFKVRPVKDFSSLSISWPIPPLRAQYLSKPFRYVSHVLGHEGAGSLLSLLKGQGWADQLSAGEARSYSDFATFDVTLELTEEGNAKAEEIVSLIFACVYMVCDRPDDRPIFDEMRDIAEVGFRFRDTVDPCQLALSLVSSLHWYKPEHVLSAGYKYTDWRPDLVKELCDLLTPERFNLVHCTHKHPVEECSLTEPWYGTPFTVAPVSESLLSACRRARDHAVAKAEMQWPDPNPFVPTDFTLACDTAPPPPPPPSEGPTGPGAFAVAPAKIREDGLATLWHKTDTTFRRPKLFVFLDLVAPAVYASPETSSLTRLFFRLVNDELTEFAYPAECASLHYSLSLSTSGLRLNAAGYNHKLPLLLEKVLSKLVGPELDPERFEIQKDLQIKEHANFFKGGPISQVR